MSGLVNKKILMINRTPNYSQNNNLLKIELFAIVIKL